MLALILKFTPCLQVIEPTVFDEAELSVYEELWDSARMITDKVCTDCMNPAMITSKASKQKIKEHIHIERCE